MSVAFRAPTPVVWLASYPRSGNTLLRVILKHCFGEASQSIYHDDEFSDPAVRSVVGHEPVGDDPHGFIARAQQGGRTLYVKTHELPAEDHNPAIYVVRDGRSAVVSHAHFIREILGRDVTLADVIRGWQSAHWSRHVKAWALPTRAATLVVRYEDLAAGDARTLAAISAFIGRPQLQAFDISFNRLHALSPNFFRCGSDAANIAELDAPAAKLFERQHGDTLRAMGYGGEARTAQTAAGSGARAQV
ncbi:MAG TPA: sulfotransferase domain-containing protein [Rhizomicrobium sp.]|nr:sulfotransferase domain-containing protein [Rhizomicrobium sp.]